MLSVHADWAVGDDVGFRTALERAESVAAQRGSARHRRRRSNAT